MTREAKTVLALGGGVGGLSGLRCPHPHVGELGGLTVSQIDQQNSLAGIGEFRQRSAHLRFRIVGIRSNHQGVKASCAHRLLPLSFPVGSDTSTTLRRDLNERPAMNLCRAVGIYPARSRK
jgi:hypothetical protein